MKKLLLLTLFFNALLLWAQDDDKPKLYVRPESDYAQDTIDTKKKVNSFQGKKKFDLSKFIIEPNINFAIYNGGIDIGLSPYFGYKVWKELYVGVGITYLYSGRTYQSPIDPNVQAKANYHTYGGGVFLQYNIWRGLFARVRFEVLQRSISEPISYYYNANGQPVFDYQKVERTYPGLFIGAGYNLLQSKNFFFPIMVSYNLLHTVGDRNYSPYRSGLVVQLGFINLF